MRYRIHRLNVKMSGDTQKLEQFLNNLKGEVVSIIPDVETLFLCYGAKIKSLLIVERLKK
ncbi:MAG: hypothetical protein GOU97_01240 [Nanoarchaeota archaeon]|nr:hypothetical protein [Nanoarchaeota archaeon]